MGDDKGQDFPNVANEPTQNANAFRAAAGPSYFAGSQGESEAARSAGTPRHGYYSSSYNQQMESFNTPEKMEETKSLGFADILREDGERDQPRGIKSGADPSRQHGSSLFQQPNRLSNASDDSNKLTKARGQGPSRTSSTPCSHQKKSHSQMSILRKKLREQVHLQHQFRSRVESSPFHL